MEVKTIKEAKRLSLLKWKAIAKTESGYISGSRLRLYYDELTDLHAQCGFCEYMKQTEPELWEANNFSACKKCPFGKIAGICDLGEMLYIDAGEPNHFEAEDTSLWEEWTAASPCGNKKSIARQIIDVIKSIPDEDN